MIFWDCLIFFDNLDFLDFWGFYWFFLDFLRFYNYYYFFFNFGIFWYFFFGYFFLHFWIFLFLFLIFFLSSKVTTKRCGGYNWTLKWHKIGTSIMKSSFFAKCSVVYCSVEGEGQGEEGRREMIQGSTAVLFSIIPVKGVRSRKL